MHTLHTPPHAYITYTSCITYMHTIHTPPHEYPLWNDTLQTLWPSQTYLTLGVCRSNHTERKSRHVLHDLRHAIVYLNWWFRAMPCAGIWGNLFGTMCCARAALHNKTGHRTQLYIICDSHKAMPSSVLASRRRLASDRAPVRRDSTFFVRLIFISCSHSLITLTHT